MRIERRVLFLTAIRSAMFVGACLFLLSLFACRNPPSGSTPSGGIPSSGIPSGDVPSISEQPEDQLVQIGSDAHFSAACAGIPEPSYQWQRDGIDIPGAIANPYILRQTVLADSGCSFRCVARNSRGSAASRSALLTVTPLSGAMRTYYVDYDSGQDSNAGTMGSPWKHAPGDRNAAGVAASTALVPGDTLSFRGGVVYQGCIKARASGTPGLPITYGGMGWGPGRAILQPPAVPDLALHEVDGFEIFGDEVCVEGFLFRNYREYAVEMRNDANPRNVSILDCEATDCGSGVMMGGSDCLTRHCYFHDMKMIVNDGAADNDYGAIGIWIGGPRNRALDNRLVRCKAPSLDYGTDGGAVEIFGGVDGSAIMRNQAFNCNGFLEAGSGGAGSARNVTVAYNLGVDNGPFCVLHGDGLFALAVSDFRIDNNTVVENTTADPPAQWSNWAMLAFPGIPDRDAILVRNNIFWIKDSQWVCPADQQDYFFTHERNIYRLTNADSRLGFTLGVGETVADPAFQDMANEVFELASSSPARGSGSIIGYFEDLLGRPVPSASRPAIGAFQSP
jgi:hypothetical protein